MKKILLFLMTICCFAIVQAQCDLKINNLVITPHTNEYPPAPTPGPTATDGTESCVYTFDASFDILTNSGFKYLFFHSWRVQDYTGSSFDCSKLNASQDPPTAATLGTALYQQGKSFLDLGFINLNNINLTSTPQLVNGNIATSYPNDPSVPLITPTNSPGLLAYVSLKVTPGNNVEDTLHFDIRYIRVTVQGPCSTTLLGVKTDIWGSNAQSGTPKAQCFICGNTQVFNDPTVLVEKKCSGAGSQPPFQQNTYAISIATLSSTPVKFWYYIYAHDPLNPNPPDPATDPIVGWPGNNTTADSITLSSANSPYLSGDKLLKDPWCCSDPWSQWPIYAVVTQANVQSGVRSNISDPGCAALPVNLKLFNAVRKNASTVELKWETAQEQNSKGFYIQRKLSNGAWQNIDFVESKAVNGNSSTPLAYAFTDLNDAKGVSQYRLRQLDIDGKQAYSEIRSVRGEGQKTNTIIYPNPSNDGKVNVLFEGANSIRNVSLLDVSGRTVRQWKGVTNNNIQIDNLTAGFYTVRILNTETGEQVVEKFIVNKR